MFEGSNVLITGGAGFIGSYLAERLLPSNTVTVFDNFSRDALTGSGLKGHPGLRVIEGDILDREAVGRAVDGCDVIFHCAAIAGIDTVGRSPVTTLKVNILGSLNVLDTALAQENMRRVVCFSTSEVYGREANGVTEEVDAHVGPPGEPRWTYAAGKLAEEHLAAAYHAEHALPTVVLRPFNVYGPRQVGEGAIRSFILRALRNESIEIRGDGRAIRAWTYVDDMVDGACRAVVSAGAVGDHFNIGNPNEPISVLDLARKVVLLASSSSEVEFKDSAAADVAERVPDITKSRDILGFEPAVDLDEGIIRTIKALAE